MALSVSQTARSRLFVCSFLKTDPLTPDLSLLLRPECFHLVTAQSLSHFLEILEQQKHQIDCLLLQIGPDLPQMTQALHQRAIVLPALILDLEAKAEDEEREGLTPAEPRSAGSETQKQRLPQRRYHQAELYLCSAQLSELGKYVEEAISRFLKLNPASRLSPALKPLNPLETEQIAQTFVTMQQQRLSEKLQERLGYLGIYYRRDPKAFLRHLPPSEQQKFLEELKADYRQIVLHYFRRDQNLNQKIDSLVHRAFFADVSVSQILEIHMELMDALAKQLKLEGRSEDILLDYRLTLIDIIAHLCEMYRRSIPRES